MKRVHIVGSARSGTTLALELFCNCFVLDGYSPRELGLEIMLSRTATGDGVYCSKNPQDVLIAEGYLEQVADLYFVYMLRDPRDVVVSRHRLAPDEYWFHLGTWRKYHAAARRLLDHERFVLVRYEDLVRQPEQVQKSIEERLPFLTRRSDFSDFHKSSRPSRQSERALHGVRPLSTASIGNWRQHKPRLAAQMQLHGSLAEDLMAMGYESDTKWLGELDGVEPDNHKSHFPE